jgi:hypothetical protein
VRRVDLGTGRTVGGKLAIHYTLDGSEPTPRSAAYAGPFRVTLGATVRALVLAEGRPVLRLAERFATDEGLHWGAYGEAGSRPVVGEQAEDARFEGGHKEEKDFGYNGIGYVDFTGRSGWVEWYEENDGSPAPSRLTVRYAATAGSKIMLSFNGGEPAPLVSGTLGEKTPGWHTVSSVHTLQSGANRVRLIISGTGETKIDELTVVPVAESKK